MTVLRFYWQKNNQIISFHIEHTQAFCQKKLYIIYTAAANKSDESVSQVEVFTSHNKNLSTWSQGSQSLVMSVWL